MPAASTRPLRAVTEPMTVRPVAPDRYSVGGGSGREYVDDLRSRLAAASEAEATAERLERRSEALRQHARHLRRTVDRLGAHPSGDGAPD